MIKCPSCSLEVPGASRFCASCGAPVVKNGHDLSATVVMSEPSIALRDTNVASNLSRGDSYDEGRFFPGILVAERYRIIGLIGRGGMGEVYRAHDLKLGQQVALKFLPEETAADEATLARFYNEVRMARQVSHPHVCRVFDIGEANGQPYISMEYVDGEDLGALLGRIGRLPDEKAVEIARKLCAGLAAAHDRGVLHRDLKPANIMIDSHGQVLIMDFGLAGVASQIQGAELRYGTPAYMAPEQLAGREVSVQSDLYALGLVLYEMFTGRQAFEADTLEELTRLRTDSVPPTLTSLVRDVDAGVERIVLRCLDSDPRKRPSSALSVAAALPGGDPLAAALAAGETPSPEVVAAARAADGLRPMVALACLGFIAAGLATFPFLNDRTTWIARTPLEYSPDTLAHKAAELVDRFGYATKARDKAFGLNYDAEYLRQDRSEPVSSSRAHPIRFWYRTSPQYLVADRFGSGGEVTKDDPPPLLSGMVQVDLDTQGRLLYFEAIPRQVEEPPGPPASADWNQLFAAAGLDPTRFSSAEPRWLPLTNTDTRAAWSGSYPNSPPNSLRVEAASWRGKAVYFQIIEPWTRPERLTPFQDDTARTAAQLMGLIVVSAVLIGACVLARHNVRLGRGDRRGAARLAATLFLLTLGNWALTTHHIPTSAELGLIAIGLSTSLLEGASVWVLYVALEPYVRRRWPQTIISWNRVLDGRFREALVGNRVLTGIAAGVALALLVDLIGMLQVRSSAAYSAVVGLNTMLGIRGLLSYLLGALPLSISTALGLFFLFFLLRALFRKEWLAGVVFVLLSATFAILAAPLHSVWVIPIRLLEYVLVVSVMMRFGLVALVAAVTVSGLLFNFPITADISAWYAGNGMFALTLVAALAAYAFHTALGGRQLFKNDVFG